MMERLPDNGMPDSKREVPISKKELVSIDLSTEMQGASDHRTSAT